MTAAQMLGTIDRQAYDVLSAPTTSAIDAAISHLTNAANHSKISLATAGVFAAFGGSRGRRAATFGVAAVTVTSVVANLVVKPIANRRRPDRSEEHRDHSPLTSHHVPMPSSDSFPSGHTAAAFAFATAVARVEPRASVVPYLIAVGVGYSRVHTGVHYPSDVALGALLGATIGAAIGRAPAVPSRGGGEA